ncbi:MAG: hypothetical protein NVSMB51_06860 [Solirubrobacteraceae bacterium]
MTSASSAPRTHRRRWHAVRNAVIERMSEGDVRWRSLGGLFVAGGLLALISITLPAPRGGDPLAIAGLGAISVVGGAGMMLLAQQLPSRDVWVSLALSFGTILVSGGILLAGTVESPLAFLYVWVGFDGFFFLTRRSAFRHILFVGVSYAAVILLLARPGDQGATQWLMTMGTVTVIGLLADTLRERSDRLISRLSDAARTDPLTELLNRRGFEQLMEEELQRARRSGRPVSLLIGDLDHFKQINDRFGHQGGDRALQQFSALVRKVKRQIDGAARIGGEEFALVLPTTDEHGAFLMAERLRRRLREDFRKTHLGLSISFGVVSFPRHGNSAGELMRSADQALYLAKRLGRDRTVLYGAEVAASLRAGPDLRAALVEQLPAVLVLAETLDLRDSGTSLHSQTVGRYAEAIALQLGLDPAHVERVRLAGLLHDVGKIGVADHILRKAGPLTETEWQEMRKHPELGARIIAGANLDDISGWVLAHHERPDGRGYPAGLRGEEIPLESRILAVADSFEAMTSDRVYRPGIGVERAREELRLQAGAQFDAGVVTALLESWAALDPGSAERTGRAGDRRLRPSPLGID